MRVTNAPASRERRRRRLERAKGFYGARSKLFRTATEAVDRALRLSTAHCAFRLRTASSRSATSASSGSPASTRPPAPRGFPIPS